MKKNVLNTVDTVVTKMDRKLIHAKMKVEELGTELAGRLFDKKDGSNHWTDILIACLLGLAIGVAVKEAIIPAIQTIFGKITGEIGQW